ncbi:MAG: hypothetical protein AB8F95_01475, partial [Bacteroidia bacterium]
SGILHVNLDLAGEEDVVLSLVDVSGRVVGRQVYPSRPEGFQTLTFEAGTIAEGIYILMIVAGDDLIELGGYKPGVVGPFGLRYNNRRKILIKR